jgi:hypothetical protein
MDAGNASTDDNGRPASALPSVPARAIAFVAILVAGVCGALIGFSYVRLQCTGNCTTPTGVGALTGTAIAAGGVAVVAVLTLRAMGEWKTIKENREHEAEQYLEDEGLGLEGREPPPLPPPVGGDGDSSDGANGADGA